MVTLVTKARLRGNWQRDEIILQMLTGETLLSHGRKNISPVARKREGLKDWFCEICRQTSKFMQTYKHIHPLTSFKGTHISIIVMINDIIYKGQFSQHDLTWWLSLERICTWYVQSCPSRKTLKHTQACPLPPLCSGVLGHFSLVRHWRTHIIDFHLDNLTFTDNLQPLYHRHPSHSLDVRAHLTVIFHHISSIMLSFFLSFSTFIFPKLNQFWISGI